MNEDKLSLGIDTSNYKTSVALVDSGGNILADARSFLTVKKGKRGLRQSEALFQHVNNLPELIATAMEARYGRQIGCVSVSERPRPVEGSYMPVFNAGLSAGKMISSALGVPLYRFSHQEGHIEAISHYASPDGEGPCICFHFSGGTTEAVLTEDRKAARAADEPPGAGPQDTRAEGQREPKDAGAAASASSFSIVGGTLDIAYGQVLDRIGVAMGLEFPCGEALDKMAVGCREHRDLLSPIKVRKGYLNLSGIETQGSRLAGTCPADVLAEDIFSKLSRSVWDMTVQLSEKLGVKRFIYAGGVSSSAYLRTYLEARFSMRTEDLSFSFGKPELSTDNAVGTALLGGKELWA